VERWLTGAATVFRKEDDCMVVRGGCGRSCLERDALGCDPLERWLTEEGSPRQHSGIGEGTPMAPKWTPRQGGAPCPAHRDGEAVRGVCPRWTTMAGNRGSTTAILREERSVGEGAYKRSGPPYR
jgi:hypothetical protein